MFSLPRPARSIAGTAFLVIATMAPTVLVLVFVVRVTQPGHTREVERGLSRMLGQNVSIESVRHPRPNVDEYTGLVIRREESGNASTLVELARADRLTISREDGRRIMRAEGLKITGTSPVDLAEQWLALTERTASAFQSELVADSAQLVCDRAGTPVVMTLHDVAAVARRASEGGGVEVTASYRFSETRSDDRCELRLAHENGADGLRTSLSLAVMEGDLPARALDPVIDATSWFGPAARVRGTVQANWAPRVAETATFAGTIDHVALDRLIDGHFPGRRLSGLGQFVVERAEWSALPDGQGRGWTSAAGSVNAGAGSIGRDFLAALARGLGFRAEQSHTQTADEVAFRDLGVRFELRPDGELRLAAATPNGQPSRSILVAAETDQPILIEPAGASSVRGLWKALLPWDEDVLVPATAESQILRHLPLPRSLGEPQRSLPAN